MLDTLYSTLRTYRPEEALLSPAMDPYQQCSSPAVRLPEPCLQYRQFIRTHQYNMVFYIIDCRSKRIYLCGMRSSLA